MDNNRVPGRPRSIPTEHFETVLQLYAAGEGYRSIANHLRSLGISAAFSSVRRLVKGEGAYRQCPTCRGTGRASLEGVSKGIRILPTVTGKWDN